MVSVRVRIRASVRVRVVLRRGILRCELKGAFFQRTSKAAIGVNEVKVCEDVC